MKPIFRVVTHLPPRCSGMSAVSAASARCASTASRASAQMSDMLLHSRVGMNHRTSPGVSPSKRRQAQVTVPKGSMQRNEPSAEQPTRPMSDIERKMSGLSSPPLDFGNTEEAFKFKSTVDIIRSILVFEACSVSWFVRNSSKLLALSRRYLGDPLTMGVIRRTFFKHFCAGENGQDIKPTVNKLAQYGVRSILDFAAEADISSEEKPGTPEITGRTLPEDIEEHECDENVSIFLECIKAAAQFEKGFAAIKVTALGRPADLERVSIVIQEIRNVFRRFDKGGNRKITYEQFASTLSELSIEMDDAAKRELFNKFDTDRSGEIDYLEWTEYLEVQRVEHEPFFTQASSRQRGNRPALSWLTPQEIKRAQNMMNRLRTIAQAAVDQKVRLLVDAEQTYFQPAIAQAVFNLQREYNTEQAYIFTTHQCYLKDTLANIQDDLARAGRKKFKYGCKLVRGAYMVAERKRALDMGYESPICDTLQDTHNTYHEALDLLFQNLHIADVMVATHNQSSIEFTTAMMSKLNVDKQKDGIFFGQLLGMSDHLTMILGANGYMAYKYVPYGPVQYVIPYLLRRADENSAVLGGGATARELALLKTELKRRLRLPF